MVKFAQIIGATALFSHAVVAAPAVRREWDSSYKQSGDSYMQSDNSYKQSDDSYKQYDNSYKQSDDSYKQYDDSYKKSDDSYKQYDDSYKKADDSYKQTDSYDKGYDTTSSYDEKKYEATQAYEYTETKAYETTTAYYDTPTYGSGQQQWGKSYDDCVSKCVAQYGAPPMEWKPSDTIAAPEGTGAVHTIMVAPMEGVLRYWPFSVNASVGDTIRYVWSTPANHTATLSSALLPCNKSALADQLKWASGVRNASEGTQTFDVVLQTDEQQFFYCSVAKHCEKGMFGMVQPKTGGNNTVSFHMQNWLESSPDLKAAWANVHEQTKDTPADSWGNNISIDDVPEDSYMDLAQNIIWSRAMFAANPGSLEANSATTADGSPIKIVGDLNTFLSSTTQDPPANVAPGTPTGSLPAPSAVASQLGSSTSAGLKTSAPVWVAAFVGAVSYLML
jgi:plastocyanin